MKKIMIFSIIAFFAILFTACSGSKDENKKVPGTSVFANDMESTGWINQNTLTQEIAHSGKFSSKLDSVSQFSFGFSDIFKNISDTLPEKVDISFWVFYPQTGITSNIVVNIDSSGKNIYWEGLGIKDSVKVANKWTEVKASFTLTKKILPTDKILIYIWNNDKRTFYIDDLKVTFGRKDQIAQ